MVQKEPTNNTNPHEFERGSTFLFVLFVPIDDEPPQPLFGMLRGNARIIGDIVSSTGELWHADD